ncbi:S-layer homology domain-containing protein [Sporosarcina sp. ANT_H38]|uniref:S-layer homology domain-containing protein n=1 Tax=Sporosarcina sp. ANT_H38 TaxID=2597358 RepID=UPI0011F28F49|nr:S-layer homology domain-containing protein [Sporosarcina sp. ANT_H38]KAA0955604.1 S-layer homology domain-containing protein [Sporosarcina sp. ANT_H38]
MGVLHKKYLKFVATAASAALVASAVAPIASAKDFSDTKDNTHYEAINALSDAGVITGYPDGTFQPNKILTRSDVVKLMGKWLVSKGYAVPTDAVSNPRFADLKSTSNKELLEYAAVVKDNGVFVGTLDGKLDPAGDITRENMAIVLVRAFDRVNDIDLATYVAGQDFKKDVNDLGTAKAEARPAIDILDFFDITNPATPAFNPKNTTTRGHFATFLHKFINADFSAVGVGVVGDTAVKAVNATTVEVTFKDAIKNGNSLKFTIDGLTVSNVAVKQSDNKTVILTTTVQEGGKEYTVSLDSKEIGKFEGVSTIVPTKIAITTQSVQGKIGQQATISADIGVKQAGVPVTFNVTPDTNKTLNKDQVFEATTNADGIATFSYTQYNAGNDEVVAYPTGAPTVRSHAFIFWGVNNILTIVPTEKVSEETASEDRVATLTNGESKTYKLTYLAPQTGKPVANQRFFVTFEENVNVNIDKASKATVNGATPMQLLNNDSPTVASVTTDSKGEAIFTVSGLNTSVTPVVFIDNGDKNEARAKTYESIKLQAKADLVTFAALQQEYSIEIFGAYGENPEAAVGFENGRIYTAMVLNKNGEPAANEVVNLAFHEDLDRVISTNTQAWFLDLTGDYTHKKQIAVKTNAYGEADFEIYSENPGDYATPIAWIDINSPNAKEGNLDEGEPFQLAPITYFAKEKPTYASLFVSDGEGAIPRSTKNAFKGTDVATVELWAANQSFFPLDLPTEYSHVDATFTIWNTGAEDIEVSYPTNAGENRKLVISPNRSHTTSTLSGTRYENPTISIETVGDTSSSVKVVANGKAIPDKALPNNTANPIDLGNNESTFEFVSTQSVGMLHTGMVTDLNTTKKLITFFEKTPISYDNATYKNERGGIIDLKEFESLIAGNLGSANVTFIQENEETTFEIISLGTSSSTTSQVNNATTVEQVVNVLSNTNMSPTFSDLNSTQKTLLATAVLTQRTSIGYSADGLQSVYKDEYAKLVAAAIDDVNNTATVTTLLAVPGLDLGAYQALSVEEKTAVEAILTTQTFTDVAALQAGIIEAIAQNETTKNVIVPEIKNAVSSTNEGTLTLTFRATNELFSSIDSVKVRDTNERINGTVFGTIATVENSNELVLSFDELGIPKLTKGAILQKIDVYDSTLSIVSVMDKA